MSEPPHQTTLDPDARAAYLLTAALTIARLVALFRTPLELYPHEARYWLWSRTLALGYDSKPPLIAWAIAATTALGGNSEPWVRLPAVLFQAGAILLVYALAKWLYNSRVGLAAAALYALAPGIQLSAMVVGADAPLLFFIALSLLAYAGLQGATARRRLLLATGLGAALGFAFLSKYAASYALVGIGLHLALSPSARRAWTPAAAALAGLAFLVVLGPNLVWNATHAFAAVHHTAADPYWRAGSLFNPDELGKFLAAQFAVFGPVPFGVLIAGLFLAARRRRLEPADLLLLCFTLPPIAIVAAQALVSRANPNWSGASYVAGAVLVAAWLMRWRARRWLIAAIAIQALAAGLFLMAVLSPSLADRLGASNSLKRARGWSQTAQAVVRRARVEGPAGLSAIAVNDRFLCDALAYYARDYLREPLSARLTIWLRGAAAGNQAEAAAPLTAAEGQRVLVVAYERAFDTEMARDFTRPMGVELDDIWLDRKHQRVLETFVGEGFRPQPRDPKTGYPTPQWKAPGGLSNPGRGGSGSLSGPPDPRDRPTPP